MKQQELLNQAPIASLRAASNPIRYASLCIVLLSFFSAALFSCMPDSESSDSGSSSTESLSAEAEIDETLNETTLPPEVLPTEIPEESDPDADGVVADGVVADGVDSSQLPSAVEASVLQDIAQNNNVPIGSLEVEAAMPQAWSDGCLGLGGPDDICTFALVEGWEVTVSGGDRVWVYRTDGDGLAVREDTEAIAG